eukprot:RCo038501
MDTTLPSPTGVGRSALPSHLAPEVRVLDVTLQQYLLQHGMGAFKSKDLPRLIPGLPAAGPVVVGDAPVIYARHAPPDAFPPATVRDAILAEEAVPALEAVPHDLTRVCAECFRPDPNTPLTATFPLCQRCSDAKKGTELLARSLPHTPIELAEVRAATGRAADHRVCDGCLAKLPLSEFTGPDQWLCPRCCAHPPTAGATVRLAAVPEAALPSSPAAMGSPLASPGRSAPPNSRVPWIGFEVHKAGAKAPLVVVDLLPGSPADRAGVQDGDEIVSVVCQKVTSVMAFRGAFRRAPAAGPVAIELRRQGKLFRVSLTAEGVPAPRAQAAREVVDASGHLLSPVRSPSRGVADGHASPAGGGVPIMEGSPRAPVPLAMVSAGGVAGGRPLSDWERVGEGKGGELGGGRIIKKKKT